MSDVRVFLSVIGLIVAFGTVGIGAAIVDGPFWVTAACFFCMLAVQIANSVWLLWPGRKPRP